MKPVDSLELADLEAHPIWAFCTGDVCDVHWVKKVPVRDLAGKLVATEVCLANGTKAWALIGNVQPGDARLTAHVLTLSVLKDNVWFRLARYHDYDYNERGPAALALFLGLSVDEVFPISYDITRYVLGDPGGLSGTIQKEPLEKLTESQLITMVVQAGATRIKKSK